MNFNVRLFGSIFIGLFLVLYSMALAGGHPSSLISIPSFIAVVGVAFSTLLVLRGPRALGLVMRASLYCDAIDEPDREKVIEAIELFERATFLGGFLCLAIGISNLINNSSNINALGPGLAVSLVGLIYCVFINAFFSLPLKQTILSSSPSPSSSPAIIKNNLLQVATLCSLIIASTGCYALMIGGNLFLSFSGIAIVLAPLACTLIASPDSFLAGPSSLRRQLWASNSLFCGGILALSLGAMRICAQLDDPATIAAGIASASSPFVFAVGGAALLRMTRPGEGIGAQGKEPPSLPYLYPSFAAVSATALAVTAVLAWMLFHQSDMFSEVAQARPR